MELTFEIRLQSDYHIASGFGVGETIDAALQRDPDGIPVIRGTSIAGLLRDGLYRLLTATDTLHRHLAPHPTTDGGVPNPLDFCPDPRRQCPLCRTLGTPACPKPWRFSSARPLSDEAQANGRRPVGAQAVTRNRIDPTARRALDNHLFTQEEGSRLLCFRFTATHDSVGGDLERDASLLVAAARMVRRLGSARRRGRGECVWHLADAAEQGRLLARFESLWLADGADAPQSVTTRPQFAAPLAPDQAPRRLRVLLRTDEPVLVAAQASSGNLFSSLGHIDGSHVWGALATSMARHLGLVGNQGLTASDPCYAPFVRLFLRDGVRLTPFYPAEMEAATSLWPSFPAPRDLLTCKHVPGFSREQGDPLDGHGAHAGATSETIPPACPVCDGPLEPAHGLLALKPRGGLRGADVAMQEEMHPRIEPQSQRVNTGDLFGYQALAAGQFFVGELWCRGEGSWETLVAHTGIATDGQLRLRLGKATRRGYGAVTLWLEDLPADAPPFCADLPLAERITEPNPGCPLVLTLGLVSDAILLDSWGRAVGSLTSAPEVLAPALAGVPVEVAPIRTFCGTRVIDGFAGHLGLPRWRDLAVAAGSAVGLQVRPQPGAAADWFDQLRAALERIERDGIGLRRAEGFGRVVFNHPVYGHFAHHRPEPIRIPDALRLATSLHGAAARRDLALSEWASTLDREFANPDIKKLFNHDLWTGLARWLHTRADGGIALVLASLPEGGSDQRKRFGHDPVLKMAPNQGREQKANWFADKGHCGMDKIRELLRHAQSLLSDFTDPKVSADLETALIRQLAARLAGIAGGAGDQS